MDLSIIIPCLNEEKNIKNVLFDVLKECKKNNLKMEIIVVDDGSTDETFSIVSSLKIKEIKLIKNKKNIGFGRSFWTGFKASKGKYTVLIAGDGETDTKIISLLSKNIKKSYDVLLAYRPNQRNRPKYRVFLSLAYTRLVNFLFNMNFKYTNGENAYKTKLLKEIKLKSNGFFFQTEILFKLTKKYNLNYLEVPIPLKKVKYKSSALRIKNIITLIYELLYFAIFR